ncbi:MAG: carbohydrate kinase family protein [Planctomycetes bacterium]|jgi:adenosine kinase|nr:carbohydrate kinase family protein [Planctomycetota bacterium]HNZ66589.1 carbohydrate kinase family protein [Planctomycetota bacterium]HPY74802.1 carbohydrate kinase family protein [Planctomycetota bacterium]HQB00443.1 carbohydrate kinase family protein [Planctomycetota bacterium]
MKKILVTGSIAYDYIMHFNDIFSQHILPENLKILNVSFTADKMSKNFGGTAGNICYSLSLLQEKPHIFSSVGQDFDEYRKRMEELNINTEYVHVYPDEWTASAHIITDQDDNQITAFHGGAMLKNNISIRPILEKECFDYAIIAADGRDGMLLHSKELKEANIPYIYDPGQSLPSFQKEELRTLIKGAKIAIMNEYEKNLLLTKAELSEQDLLQNLEFLLITKGGKGSVMYQRDKEPVVIPPAKAKKVVDPTGAGDAYRGGLLKGLLLDLPLQEAAYLGSVVGSYAVEHVGTQSYSYTPEQFIQRFIDSYGTREYLEKLFV